MQAASSAIEGRVRPSTAVISRARTEAQLPGQRPQRSDPSRCALSRVAMPTLGSALAQGLGARGSTGALCAPQRIGFVRHEQKIYGYVPSTSGLLSECSSCVWEEDGAPYLCCARTRMERCAHDPDMRIGFGRQARDGGVELSDGLADEPASAQAKTAALSALRRELSRALPERFGPERLVA